tara:strand:- start:20605 stop:21666 length:1062 start_codon:yes stop_codon:yes gene_type:complete
MSNDIEREAEYSQGIMAGAGAVVLKDGEPLTVDEIVAELNRLQAARSHGGSGEAVTVFSGLSAFELKAVAMEIHRVADEVSDGEEDYPVDLVYCQTVTGDDGKVQKGPFLCVRDGEYPEEGVWPITVSQQVRDRYTRPTSSGGVPEGFVETFEKVLARWMNVGAESGLIEYTDSALYTKAQDMLIGLSTPTTQPTAMGGPKKPLPGCHIDEYGDWVQRVPKPTAVTAKGAGMGWPELRSKLAWVIFGFASQERPGGYGHSDAERALDAATEEGSLSFLRLLTTQPAGGEWCDVSTLTLSAMDERGDVWGRDAIGNIKLVKAEEVIDGWLPTIETWQPTGLTRPQPPMEGDGHE